MSLEQTEKNILWKNWIISKEWDGEDRFTKLCNTIKVHDTHIIRRDLYLKKWLSQMVYLTCLTNPDYTDPSYGRLMMIFTQVGKVNWLQSLVPEDKQDYVLIYPKAPKPRQWNDYSIDECAKYTFVELQDTILPGSKFKQYTQDKFIAKFPRKVCTMHVDTPQKWCRYTVYFSSITDSTILSNITNSISRDEKDSGFTIFLLLPVIECVTDHNINMQQVYAQLLAELHKESQFGKLTKDEMDLIY